MTARSTDGSDESQLYADVQAMAGLSHALAVPEAPIREAPIALERGVREHPDGVVEHYERIEYARQRDA